MVHRRINCLLLARFKELMPWEGGVCMARLEPGWVVVEKPLVAACCVQPGACLSASPHVQLAPPPGAGHGLSGVGVGWV